MTMMPSITIGFKDLCLSLICQCSTRKKPPLAVLLSLSLKGYFLPAALSDNIDLSIDYDLLASRLTKSLKYCHCQNMNKLLVEACSLIRDNSPLITGGYLEVSLNCQGAFIKAKRLL